MLKHKQMGMAIFVISAMVLGACAPAATTTTIVTAPPVVITAPPVVQTQIVTVNGTPSTVVVTATPAPAQPTAATSFKSKDPTTLTEETFGDPDTLEPAFCYETACGAYVQSFYDTLVWYNKDKADQFVPNLATDVPSLANGGISADGKTYTFKIRTGVKFHNGDTLTPDDVAYSFQMGLLMGGSASPQWLLFQPILGVAASPSGNNDITDLVDPSGKLLDDQANLAKADPAKLAAACQTVTSAIVADDTANTVVVHLAQPWGPFLATIANSWGSISEKKWVGANGGWDGDCKTWQNFYFVSSDTINKLKIGTTENGTGPYMLDHWTPTQEIVFKANPNYWRTTPAFDGGPSGVAKIQNIIIKNVTNFSTRLAALQAGDADFITPGSSADWAQMDPMVGEVCDQSGACKPGDNPANPLRVYKGLDQPLRTDVFMNFAINTTGGNPYIGSGKLDGNGIPANFFNDLNVRQGMNYCFDWDTYIKDVQVGEGVQSFDVMLPGEIGYSDKDPHFTFDADKCKAAFQASTQKGADGKSLWDTGFRFTIAYNTGNTARQDVAQILQADLNAVNPKFVVEATALPWPTFLAAQRAKQLAVFVSGWQEDIHDPHDWLVPYATSGGAYSARQSMPADMLKIFQPLINAGAQETDPAKRAAIYEQFNQAFYTAAPDIILAVQQGRHYEQRWVSGFFNNPIYPGFYYYNLSKS
jgi:peptide/nickel transport system substrate-binding protein